MSIYEQLYDWQKKVVDEFKIKRSFGLFLKMGLGKTPVSLGLAEANECTKAIIITINSKALESVSDDGSWLYWANKSAMKYNLISKTSKPIEFNPDNNEVFLINYESLFSKAKDRKCKVELKDAIKDFIQSCKGHNVAIIVDESHKMKNLQSKQTLAINRIKQELKLKATAIYTYLLTGTPFTTGYEDLYSQLKMLGYDETKGQFVDQFCIRGNIPGLLGWQQPIVGYKNIDQLFRLMHRYSITIETNDVVKLPEQIFVDHYVEASHDFRMFCQEYVKGDEILTTIKRHGATVTDDLRSAYNIESLDKKYSTTKQPNPFFRNIAFPKTDWVAETNGTMWMRARQLSIGFQGNAEVCEWFDKRRLKQLELFLTNNDDNYVLFYNYTPELIEIYNICEKLGYNIDVYCGEIKSLTHYNKYSAQTEAERLMNTKNIILANFASGSTGMNWQLYSSCIIFSTPLFKDYEQGLARIHRLGQKNTTIYHTFYQKNWLDEGMRKALAEQKDYSFNMFNSDLLRVQHLLSV